jgi:hypothetical protein
MKRFWIQFKFPLPSKYRMGLGRGCGVTAYDLSDALAQLSDLAFEGDPVPEIESVVENVDISTLDAGHVLPNMGNPLARGIWFPMGFTPGSS